MAKKAAVVRARKPARKLKDKTSKPPRKPAHPKGYLMGEVAVALFQQYQYLDVVTFEAWEKLLAEQGRPMPEGLDGHKERTSWLHSQRYMLNAFGCNRDLLLTLGNEDVLALGFSLTSVNGREGEAFQLLTVWGDITSRDRPKEVTDKTIKMSKDHRNAQPFSPDDKITQAYYRKIFKQEAEALKNYHEECELRIQMIAADTERVIVANKRKQLKG